MWKYKYYTVLLYRLTCLKRLGYMLVACLMSVSLSAQEKDSVLVTKYGIYSLFYKDSVLFEKSITIHNDSLVVKVEEAKRYRLQQWENYPELILSLDSILFHHPVELVDHKIILPDSNEMVFFAPGRWAKMRYEKRYDGTSYRIPVEYNLWKTFQADSLHFIVLYDGFKRNKEKNGACWDLHDRGMIVPLKDGGFFTPSGKTEQLLSNDYEVATIPVKRSSINDTDTIRIDGRYGLYTLWGEEVIPAVYDSLCMDENGSLIVAHRGNSKSLIDYHGNILKENLKEAKHIREKYQVIDAHNRMFFIDTEGTETVEYRFGRMSVDDMLFDITPGSYLFPYKKKTRESACWVQFEYPWGDRQQKQAARQANWWIFLMDTVYTYGLNEMMYKETYYQRGFTYFDMKPFFIPNEYKDLQLINNKQQFYDSGDYEQLPKNWIITRKKKKYGIIRINYDYNVSQVLPFEYDKITGKVFFIDHFLLLERKGLKCYYPISSQPRYKELGSFIYHFARFQLPDGRQGWLDKEGNEYMD